MTSGPAVAVQLEHVFAGEGMRRGEEEREARVDGAPAGIGEDRDGCVARRRHRFQHRRRDRARRRAGDADDADAAAARGRGGGDDRVLRRPAAILTASCR